MALAAGLCLAIVPAATRKHTRNARAHTALTRVCVYCVYDVRAEEGGKRENASKGKESNEEEGERERAKRSYVV